MKKHTKIGLLAGFYLGGSIGWFGNMHMTDWQFWVIIVPTIVLFGIEKELYKKDK